MYKGGKLFVHKIDERFKSKNEINPSTSYIIIKDIRRPNGNLADDIIEDHKRRIELVKNYSRFPQFWDHVGDESIPPGGTIFQGYGKNPLPDYLKKKSYSEFRDDEGEFIPNYIGAFIPLYIHYTINFDGSGGHATDERYNRHYGFNAISTNPDEIKIWGRNRKWDNLNTIEKKIVELDLEKSFIIMNEWKGKFFIAGSDQVWSDSKLAQASWLSEDNERPIQSFRLDSASIVNANVRNQRPYIRSKLKQNQNEKLSASESKKKKKKRTKKKKKKPSSLEKVEEVEEPSF